MKQNARYQACRIAPYRAIPCHKYHTTYRTTLHYAVSYHACRTVPCMPSLPYHVVSQYVYRTYGVPLHAIPCHKYHTTYRTTLHCAVPYHVCRPYRTMSQRNMCTVSMAYRYMPNRTMPHHTKPYRVYQAAPHHAGRCQAGSFHAYNIRPYRTMSYRVVHSLQHVVLYCTTPHSSTLKID